ncbi:KilA-N domain-containing protein [Laribacter hongkongensis]|uniref:KilA-N domain-containing protein n=1 Tax=Laribacter hongkongensis TaxID=168471 RepID=UPI001EFC7604|nr:KilA-N domain-containing protein [Laribacter hongkongensis]MCG9065193.1 KilA-N domain-containing protein [Laribacter hongkongensis]
MNNRLIKANFDGSPMQFNPDGWFNATLAAEPFGKEPYDWLRQRDTVEYLAALSRHNGNSGFVEELNKIRDLPGTSSASQVKLLRLAKKTGFVRARAGCPDSGGGTWLHPKLAVRFAQWLEVDFAIWCDEQVDALIRGTGDVWEAARAGAAQQHRGVCDMVRLTRQAIGKTTQPHHYINEARLINLAMTGSTSPVDRSSLSKSELRLLELVERQDMVLVGMGRSYEQRKTELLAFASSERQRLALPVCGSTRRIAA